MKRVSFENNKIGLLNLHILSKELNLDNDEMLSMALSNLENIDFSLGSLMSDVVYYIIADEITKILNKCT